MSDSDASLGRGVQASVDDRGYGRSALLLVECLIHGLIARGTLTSLEAVEIATSAHDVLCDLNDDHPVGSGIAPFSEKPLLDILASMRIDLPVENRQN